jgi:serine/threonine protein kinase/Tol biopolymer transport system component
MRLAPGKQLGPYEITAMLGVGGMGEVYRARDTRLERTVAIKILSQLSSDLGRRQRFEREAKAISGLNHPNICVLHDIGHQDGLDYLVMECVEGETLATRLEKGPLPVEQVLKYGAQIADALDKAHRAGIVHRDLKPHNIMLTATGAKLLDFGLAKPASSLVDLAAMTATKAESPITEQGTIVGTFQYMSPEQVEGRELDGRSDIFSLGAVLYEMVTGQRAFEGKSRLSVASAILEKEPAPLTTTKPLTPPALDHAIRNCLAKDPDDRWQTARDLSHELKWIGEAGSQAGAPAVAGRSGGTARIAWVLAAVLLAAFGLLSVAHFTSKGTPSSELVVRSSLLPPAGTQFNAFDSWLPAVSADGTHIVFPVWDGHGKRLWLRALNDTGDGKALPGTEDGSFPFWSPDGRSIGFFADEKLKRIDIEGNFVQVLSDSPIPRGGTWSQDGVILFAPSTSRAIYQIPANGGTPKQVTELNAPRGEQSHRWPVFLPDGKHFLFFIRSEQHPEIAGIYAGSLDSNDYHLVVKATMGHAFEAHGTLVYVRDGAVFTQRFDEEKLTTIGEPVALPDRVAFNPENTSVLFSVSPAGVMVYYPATPGGPFALTWYDRNGKRDPVDSGNFLQTMALSPDGTQVVVSILNSNGMGSDLWNLDLARGTKIRLTSGPGIKREPVWQPDGQFVLFFSGFTGSPGQINRIKGDGSGTSEIVLKSDDSVDTPRSVCHEGNYLAFTRNPVGAVGPALEKATASILPLTGDRKPFPLIPSQFGNLSPAFSPDCKWVAYVSIETGQREVYVTHFPDASHRYRVSTQGGTLPRWSGDGKELFYAARNSILAVSVDEKPDSISLGTPRTIISAANYGAAAPVNFYDMTANGQRFLMTEANSPKGPVPLTLVTNWDAALKKR